MGKKKTAFSCKAPAHTHHQQTADQMKHSACGESRVCFYSYGNSNHMVQWHAQCEKERMKLSVFSFREAACMHGGGTVKAAMKHMPVRYLKKKNRTASAAAEAWGVEEVGGLLAWSHLKRIINTAGFNVGILLVTPGAGFIWNNKKVLLLPSTVSVSFTNPHSDFCTHWHANYNLNSRCSIFLESQFTLVLPYVTHDTVQSAWEEGKHNYFPSKCFPAGSSSKDENITSPKHCYR